MNGNFDNQKEFLLSLRQEISLLRQQIDYLIRNEKELQLLDLDVLMNRTHTIYGMLCSVNVSQNEEEQDLDLDPEALYGLFGGLTTDEASEETNDSAEAKLPTEKNVETLQNEPIAIPGEPEEIHEETAESEKTADEISKEDELEYEYKPEPELEPEALPEEQNPAEETFAETREWFIGETLFTEPDTGMETPIEEAEWNLGHVAADATAEPIETEQATEEEPDTALPTEEEAFPAEPKTAQEPENEQQIGDEYGFFFRFDISESEEETPQEEVKEPETEEEPEEQEEKIVHFMEEIPENEIPEKDLIEGDELVQEDPYTMPVMEDEVINEPASEITEHPVFDHHDTEEPAFTSPKYEEPSPEPAPFFENAFDNDETDYEIDSRLTIGERMQHEDHSLAARYQQNTVGSLKSAIGINDKFLLVNELFGGSMEKYNKSIENLDDLMTQQGAMIYLNELKVELQWNSNNVAYKKLTELIQRKFNG